MPSVFGIKRRDNLPLLKATLWEDAEKTTPVDLTNADVIKLKVGRAGQPLIIDRPVDIVDPPTTGKVQTQITSVESNKNPENYQMEFEVTWGGTEPNDVSTYPKEGFLTFTIHPDLDPPE